MTAASPYHLSRGKHPGATGDRCAMEWVSFIAGEGHSDHPVCVSPLLGVFCRSLNDALDDGTRQKMRPYLARTIGTADDGRDEERVWMCLDWLVRVHAPPLLDAVPRLRSCAATLRNFPPMTPDTVGMALPVLSDVYGVPAWRFALASSIVDSSVYGVTARTGATAAEAAIWSFTTTKAAAWSVVREVTARATLGPTADNVFGCISAEAPLTVVAEPAVVAELQNSAFDLLDRMLPKVMLELPELAALRAQEVCCAA